MRPGKVRLPQSRVQYLSSTDLGRRDIHGSALPAAFTLWAPTPEVHDGNISIDVDTHIHLGVDTIKLQTKCEGLCSLAERPGRVLTKWAPSCHGSRQFYSERGGRGRLQRRAGLHPQVQ